jgi:hypothetical protein
MDEVQRETKRQDEAVTKAIAGAYTIWPGRGMPGLGDPDPPSEEKTPPPVCRGW